MLVISEIRFAKEHNKEITPELQTYTEQLGFAVRTIAREKQ